MIDSKTLLADLQKRVRPLEDDLRQRCDSVAEVDAPLKAQYDAAKSRSRTALTYKAWREEELTNVAVAWVLGCVFVRFLEDNELVETPKLAGSGLRLQRARDEHELFIRKHPLETEREYLLAVFEETGRLPGMREFFDRRHNPLWTAAPLGDACRELLLFWQRTDPETGALEHDFRDPDWNTRFLGDLYQDLSETARKRYALLQTPEFVERFILDRTLDPAIQAFGFREVRMIDPTCGSGHFLLGGFDRLFRIWQAECPGENPRVLAQQALNQVCGVDLNPNVVAIARFRLLLATLKVCGIRRLADAPDFQLQLATGDSLLHGRRFRRSESDVGPQRTFDTEEVFRDELRHHFETEDGDALHQILGRQYHAVVGNPPYITVKDRALSEHYRARYSSCHRAYSLSVPFMERFFDLAVCGDGTPQQPAGFVGQITSNSFMKREFGKKLIEEFIPRWDLTHVIDTAGAYIPGHGTPTVILFGKNQPPANGTIRTVLGIAGEPATPNDPAQGLVWLAIVRQIDEPGSVSKWVSVTNSDRSNFHSHPWSIGGGGAAELKQQLDEAANTTLSQFATDMGFGAVTRLDDTYEMPVAVLRRHRIGDAEIKDLVTGDNVRDWQIVNPPATLWPYDTQTLEASGSRQAIRFLWPYRWSLVDRVAYGKTQIERGLTWFEYSMFFRRRYQQPRSLTFACVATHNHFVFDEGGRLFNRHAPLVKLAPDAAVEEHIRLLGSLNSSAGCFWLKQVAHNKGSTVDQKGARQRTAAFEDFFEFTSAQLTTFPIPAHQPSQLSTALVKYSTAMQGQWPAAILADWGGSEGGEFRECLAKASDMSTSHRCRLIAWQEELDWQIYEAFGFLDAEDAVSLPEGQAVEAIPPEGIELGQRAFEILLARRMVAGDVQTTWFERHLSTPITKLPEDWPAAYRDLVERRIARIEIDPNIRLIEQPEYKRRWNTEPWDEQFQRATREWLLARLEGYFFEGDRVCKLVGGGPGGQPFAPAVYGFTAAERPHLTTANTLADAAQADSVFMEVAENYMGGSGFSVSKLVRELVETESVPYLPAYGYKESGRRKRREWEHVWDLQRKEDEIETDVRAKSKDRAEEELKRLVREAQRKQVGDIPVPSKYAQADFAKSSYWKLRGKLDVPKERWISYPGAERGGDASLVIAWAGWDHLQQAQTLAEYYIDAQQNQGWQPDRLKPLLAGLADLIPWLKQWHNEPDPSLGMGLGDYFLGFLQEQARMIQTTEQELDALRFEAEVGAAGTRTQKPIRVRRRTKGEGDEIAAGPEHWQDKPFALLAPNRRKLTDYRMIIWPEILRQMSGDLEFDVFRKTFWLLSEPGKLETLSRDVFPDLPSTWWRSRTERLMKEDFLPTLKGSVKLGDVKIWKTGEGRFIRRTGHPVTGSHPEAVDDARIALQVASHWNDETGESGKPSLEEEELRLLET